MRTGGSRRLTRRRAYALRAGSPFPTFTTGQRRFPTMTAHWHVGRRAGRTGSRAGVRDGREVRCWRTGWRCTQRGHICVRGGYTTSRNELAFSANSACCALAHLLCSSRLHYFPGGRSSCSLRSDAARELAFRDPFADVPSPVFPYICRYLLTRAFWTAALFVATPCVSVWRHVLYGANTSMHLLSPC